MTEAVALEGRCLCGAVTINVTRAERAVSACHCRLCQRWSGGAFMGFDAPPEAVTVTGDVRAFASSSFADRVFCATCGTHLWFRDHGEDTPYELPPGLFDGAADFPLVREVYADRAMTCCRFAGDHPRLTAAEYEANNPFVEGDAP